MSQNELLQYDKDLIEEKLKNYGQTNENLVEYVCTLREWLEKQPHLPKDISTRKLEAFLVMNKFSIEKAKEKLDSYFTVRTLLPQYFEETYATSKRLQSAMESSTMVPLPKQLDGHRIFVAKVLDPNPEHYDPISVHACIFHILDIILEEDMSFGVIIVSDMKDFTLGHAIKADLMVAKHAKIYAEEVYSGRVKSIHFVNLNSMSEVTLKLLKSILKPKIAARIHIHRDYDSLCEVIPKELLPKDFGGELKSYQEIVDDWKEVLIKYEPHFQKLRSIKIDESLRPKELISELFEDLQGNFRKLNVD